MVVLFIFLCWASWIIVVVDPLSLTTPIPSTSIPSTSTRMMMMSSRGRRQWRTTRLSGFSSATPDVRERMTGSTVVDDSDFRLCHRHQGTRRCHRDRDRDRGLVVHAADPSSSATDDADRYRSEAEKLREQVRRMEEELEGSRLGSQNKDDDDDDDGNDDDNKDDDDDETSPPVVSLKGRRIMVVGANGRLGSMVCRHLLRNHRQTEVIAAVHVVGEESSTARGYGRLSYEIGAEDGTGTIGPAWSGREDDRRATFVFSPDSQSDANLRNVRIVPVELLDPLQCRTILGEADDGRGVDSIVWCATDFNGNTPRAVSGLNVAFLFRAVADPTKGRVEVEGLRNLLSGMENQRQQTRRKRWMESTATATATATKPKTTTPPSSSPSSPPPPSPPPRRTTTRDDDLLRSSIFDRRPRRGSNEDMPSSSSSSSSSSGGSKKDPVNVVLVSTMPDVFQDYETPFGTFYGLKQEGETMLSSEFGQQRRTLTYTILQMARYDDNFVEEHLDLQIKMDEPYPNDDDDDDEDDENGRKKKKKRNGNGNASRRRINRRDAARAACEALTNPEWKGKTIQVWTAPPPPPPSS